MTEILVKFKKILIMIIVIGMLITTQEFNNLTAGKNVIQKLTSKKKKKKKKKQTKKQTNKQKNLDKHVEVEKKNTDFTDKVAQILEKYMSFCQVEYILQTMMVIKMF